MEQCKTCEYYEEDFDIMMIQHDDILIEGKKIEENHYCRFFKFHPIQTDIFYGKKKCKKYRLKEDFSEEEEFLSRMSEEDIETLAKSKSNEEIEKIIAKYSD